MRKGKYIWFCLMAGALVGGFAAFRSGNETEVSVPLPTRDLPQSDSSIRIFDKSPINPGLFLFSRSSSGDLWFRNAMGQERCLASNVVRASFSPDGKKFAFGTSDNEIYIFTVNGDQLTRLAGASDHVWSSSSSALTFSATASPDYPELQETVVYHLTTNVSPTLRSGR